VPVPAREYVGDLKARDGGDIGIHGSITLAGSLLRDRLCCSPTAFPVPSSAVSGGGDGWVRAGVLAPAEFFSEANAGHILAAAQRLRTH
jgi:hypothetical protein